MCRGAEKIHLLLLPAHSFVCGGQVMARLGEDVEVSDDVWVALISSMQQRMQDKVPFVRVFAASALARLVTGNGSGIEDDPTLLTYQEALENDRSAVSFLLPLLPHSYPTHDPSSTWKLPSP